MCGAVYMKRIKLFEMKMLINVDNSSYNSYKKTRKYDPNLIHLLEKDFAILLNRSIKN
jgi:hypothetical protein